MLGSTRMVCRVENARLSAMDAGLQKQIAVLDQFQEKLEAQKGQINGLNKTLKSNVVLPAAEIA